MDLQSAEILGGREGLLSRLAVAACLAVSCALLIGSLVAPGSEAAIPDHRMMDQVGFAPAPVRGD
jgi:hypothetical protein